MRRRSLLSAALAAPLALPRFVFAQPPVRVVASFSILGDMVAQIGGGRVQLRTIAGQVTSGRAAVVVVEGEAGIGKTRLAEAAAEAGRAAGWTVAWSRCADDAGAPDAVRDHLGLQPPAGLLHHRRLVHQHRPQPRGRPQRRPEQDPVAAADVDQPPEPGEVVGGDHVPGLLLGGELAEAIGVDEAERLLAEGALRGGIVPKLRAAVGAAREGVDAAIGATAVLA